MDMHPFRDRIRRSAGMGGVPAERPLWRTRPYEAAGGETPSALPDPPQESFQIICKKKKTTIMRNVLKAETLER